MSELSVDLFSWEKKAFDEGAQLALQIEGDNVVVTGKPEAMRKALPLADLHWIEIEGYIRAMVHDPIPNRARQMVNALMAKVLQKRRKS